MVYARRIRALKPLDPAIREQEAVIRIGLACRCALAGRWEEGRDHFRAAEELWPEIGGQLPSSPDRAVFEAKAGQRDESDRFLKEAQASLPEPAPLWLALAIESSRYQMSAATTNGYRRALDRRAQEKMPEPDGRRDGGSAHWMSCSSNVDYPGRDGSSSSSWLI